ncbi:High-affinity zinc uptake system membrane protein ZnuB [subsurface metagenome]
MLEFVNDIGNFSFLQYALLTGLLASFACGIVGSYITVRRISYIAGAIAHSTLGGMGAARYLQRNLGFEFLTPIHGAFFAALLAAIIIGLVTLYGKQREDTVLSAVWAIGMAVGIFFITRTAGYNEDLMSYLFGNILMVRRGDLLLIAALDVLIVAVSFLFYHKLEAVCFDAEFARLRGISVEAYYILLLCLTALTIVTLLQVVGIVMVIAMLALPAAAAACLTRRLWQTMLLATLLSLFCMIGGLALSYQPNLPAGATIIVLAGAVYLLILIIKPLRIRKRYRVN